MLDGSGTRDDPYQITSGQELESINEDPSAFYELSNDIKFENGVSPIGQFSGVFDGQGHRIQGNNTTIKDVLFSETGEDAIIRNIGIIDVQIENADRNYYTGGLVSQNFGEISNVYSTGTVNGDVYTGGLVGFNVGEISNSYSTGTVNGEAEIGGLVGCNHGTVSNSYSAGTVNGVDCIGGLVGWSKGEISDSYFTGILNGTRETGGLVGWSKGEISDSYFTGILNGTRETGGLVGVNVGEISDSYSEGTVEGDDNTGGLVGWSDGEISNAYFTGTVNGEADIGGLVGVNKGSANCCWTTVEDNYSLIGVNEGDYDCVFDFEECNGLSLDRTDVRLDSNDWSVSYDLDSQTLGLLYNKKTYNCSNTSPMEVQELVERFDQYVVEVSNKFKASVVSNI